MTRTRLLAVLCAAFTVLAAVGVFAQAALLTRLGISESAAHEAIYGSFSSGYLIAGPATHALKKVPTAERPALVNSVVAFAKAFVASPAFAKRYAAEREAHKPKLEPAKTGAQVREELRKTIASAIQDAEALVKAKPEMKKQVEPAIAEMRRQLEAIGNDKEAAQAQDRAVEAANKEAAAEHQQAMAAFEVEWPLDHKPLIAKRLSAFLEVSASVDFAAKTVLRGKRQVFADEQLEAKDPTWKLLFRAGKPAVEAARQAAQAWLKAI